MAAFIVTQIDVQINDAFDQFLRLDLTHLWVSAFQTLLSVGSSK